MLYKEIVKPATLGLFTNLSTRAELKPFRLIFSIMTSPSRHCYNIDLQMDNQLFPVNLINKLSVTLDGLRLARDHRNKNIYIQNKN